MRKRAFDYMDQGVSKMGEDIEAAKKVIDEIKVNILFMIFLYF